ncbi:peptidase U32 family protein [uncultured Alistipes sp.]|uniref:peptidase U32 family protein n=1 Tax=uncultured Alistipes sp. TaxID=538949 RepID=UPI0026084B2E|nr:peptidase U32 family protein [uncultured Alistipes sp.]
MKRTDIELMAPAGSYEALRAAVQAGADAIYFGVGQLNMRSKSAANFTLDDLEEIVRIAREAGVKSYLTVNTVVYEDELRQMHELIDRARMAGVDAVIASDIAAILYARRTGVEVHISTQCNVTNSEAAKFYAQWADVVVLARELSLDQIGRIAREIADQRICGPSGEPLRIEMFAHGALCMAVSGKCYLSLHETGCSANRGACRQICRRKYLLTDAESGAQLLADGRYLLSPKDLCTIDFLDRFIAAGVRVLKIEGRARGAEYVKRVVTCYDRALRALEEGSYTPELAAALKQELETVFNRGFWQGYYAGAPMAEHTEHYGSSASRRKVYVGKVTNFFKKPSVAEVYVEAAPVARGEELFFQGPTTGIVELTADPYVGNKPAEEASQGCFCSFKTPSLVRRGDQLYKMVPADASNSQPD